MSEVGKIQESVMEQTAEEASAEREGSKPASPAHSEASGRISVRGSKPGTPLAENEPEEQAELTQPIADEDTNNSNNEATLADGGQDQVKESETQADSDTQQTGNQDNINDADDVEENQNNNEGTADEPDTGAADENDGTAGDAEQQGSPSGSKPLSPAGSKPSSATGSKHGSATASKQGSATGAKPGSATRSKAGTPAGSRSRTPIKTDTLDGPAAADSKQGTPAGSRTGTPTAESKQGTPAESKQGTPAGSRTGTPTVESKQGTPTGSKQGTPTGSRTVTPTAESKQGTPSGSKQGIAAGSRTGTPTAESKQGTPAGSKQGTPAASRAGTPLKQPTPTGSKPTSRQGTPVDSRPGSGGKETAGIPPGAPPPPALKSQPSPSEDQEPLSTRALNIIWSFGLNKNVPLLNLTDGQRTVVLYVCAHTGVLYDYRSNSQTLLQGHGNAISCTCVSGDKRWVATADQGHSSLIIVWDTYTGIPVRTIFEGHEGGVVAITMTPDAKYLATLSAAIPQTLAIWDWTVEGETPLCTAQLEPSYSLQTYLHFNPSDVTQLVTNSEGQVVFYSWQGEKLLHCAPPLTDEDFNKPVGKFSQSIFLQGSTKALTATTLGNLVVWDTNTLKPSGEGTHNKKALKLVKLQEKSLTVLTLTEKFIVTGDTLGHVKFFDENLKLINWYQDLHLGPINSVSFAHNPAFSSQATWGKNFPSDATIHAKPMALQDFVIGTTSAVYAHVTTDGTDIEIIHKDHDGAVHALVSHPNRPFIFIGSYSGLLKVWNYEKRQVVVSRQFQHGNMISCCNIDPQGHYLAVGFTTGALRVLDTISLDDVISDTFTYARDTITHVTFSHDSRYLATADAEHTVSLYKASTQPGEEVWQYVGRYHSHYKLIQDIMFSVHLDSNLPRLLSLGQDRVLAEYDLENSYTDNLLILSMDRIEQSAVPQCMVMYPPVTKESFILTANDQFKFKLYNATTKMCRQTLLSPTYGSPVQKVVVLPMMAEQKGYAAYITDNKVGLQILPLNGNPHNSMALIAHPQGVTNIVASHDGKYLFTAGGIDATVHMWAINVDALHAQAKLGGEDLIPFYGLLDGGRDGELFRELEDYFYYAQIRSQGVNTHEKREASKTIPVSEIPFVMRAMGFYPSEQEVEDMLNEVKYSTYVDTGSYKSEIDLGDFIKLYINHRPAFGLQPDKLAWAFDVLGFDTIKGPAIDRGDLLNLLQSSGEAMTEYELAEYLTTLLGFNEEGGSSELQEFDPDEAGDIIDKNLPYDVTAEMFANDLLGFDMYLDYNSATSRGSTQISGAAH